MPDAALDPAPKSVRKRIGWLDMLVIAFWLYFLAVLASSVSVWIELAAHFVWQALLGGAVIVGLCVWRQRWRASFAALLPWCYLLCLFQPWSLWLSSPAPERAHRLTVMSWNVLCINENLEELRQVIESHPVDILVLIEVRPNLFEQIPILEKMYKHRLAFPSWGGNGIAVLTNREDLELSRVDFDGKIMPSIVASVGQSLKVVGMHTWSPFPPARAVPRDQQLSALVQWVRDQEQPVCVVGDLNITPWAPAFKQMLNAGLVDSRASGFGNSASWPAWLGPLGIPIDHALSYGPCSITNRQLGPMVSGSDHRPVLMQIEY